MFFPQKIKNTLFIFAVCILALASFFTVCHLFGNIPDMGMSGHMDTRMSLSASPACCQNTGMNHALHASMLETLTKNINFEKTILALGLFIMVWLAFYFRGPKKLIKPKTYFVRYLEHRLRNYIFAALAKGLLQPKIYSF